MATNAELEAKIKLLDQDVATSELNKSELTALLRKLEDAQEAQIVADAKAKLAAENAKTKDAPAPAEVPPYFMLKGKALCTKKGIKADGDEVKPEWVAGGVDTLELFVAKGYIGKS